MQVLVILRASLLSICLVISASGRSHAASSDARGKPNNGTAEELPEEVMEQKREKLLNDLLDFIEEGDRSKNIFSDPLVAVNYAKQQEVRRMKERFRTGKRRVRRSAQDLKRPSPYSILEDSEDVLRQKSDSFLVETLPENLQEVKQGSYIHFRICAKAVIPEEVNTDRKLQFPLDNCDDIEDGGPILLDDVNLPYPWLYRTFSEGEFVIVKMAGRVVLRYCPRSRHLGHYLTDASAYNHKTNRSVIISLLIDRQLTNEQTEVLVESQSVIVAPIQSNYFTRKPLRGQPKWPAYFNFTVNTVTQPSAIIFEADSPAPRVLFNDLAGSNAVSDADWLPSRSGQTVCVGNADVSEGACLSPIQVVATMRQLRGTFRHSAYSRIPGRSGEQEGYSVRPKLRRFSSVIVVEVGDAVTLHCHTTQADTDLRIWHSRGAFRTQKQHFYRVGSGGNMSGVDAVLVAVQPTLSWSPNTFIKTNDIYVTDERVLSRVTCGSVRGKKSTGQSLEPQSLHFIVLDSAEYTAFIKWGSYSIRTGTKRVPLRRPLKAKVQIRKVKLSNREDTSLIMTAVFIVVVPGLLAITLCRVFRRRSEETITRPSGRERQNYRATLQNVEERLRKLQARMAERKGDAGGRGDTRSLGDLTEARTPAENLRPVSA
ncbi:hypothetical protein SprV_0902745500 [Sparganum proliferum]